MKTKKRVLALSPIWKIVLFLQVIAMAWIGFTHGSPLETMLQAHSGISEKFILQIDRNLAGLLCLLGLIMLWKPYRWVFLLLAAIYFCQALFSQMVGGYAPDPWPLLGSAAIFVLPLVGFAIADELWARVLVQLGVWLTVGLNAYLLILASPFYYDRIAQASYALPWHTHPSLIQAVAIIWAVLWVATLFFPKKGWGLFLLFVFNALAVVFYLRSYGSVLLPEGLLQFSLFLAALSLYQRVRPMKTRLSF